ncbi:flavin reductase like protein [Pseudonocardia sediminis]|uniref:Flavin reductase like protein n=1 Tax=Pseudonocardia sediminis TaxID=1397368 RepID=A0A4V2FR71_PSEST|nr:flavin reductase family protein [Pseudonocardia sediminis]RZT87330.1 flavin reductase like protein [Pseudonocardia sediminis]
MSARGASAPLRFREARASFPSGVTIVAPADSEGRWWGFTATSFCSLSVEPPLVLAYPAERADCHRRGHQRLFVNRERPARTGPVPRDVPRPSAAGPTD